MAIPSKIRAAFMKGNLKAAGKAAPSFPMTPAERGFAAAKAMSRELLAEQRRWNMPFITWKNGKVVEDRRHLKGR